MDVTFTSTTDVSRRCLLRPTWHASEGTVTSAGLYARPSVSEGQNASECPVAALYIGFRVVMHPDTLWLPYGGLRLEL